MKIAFEGLKKDMLEMEKRLTRKLDQVGNQIVFNVSVIFLVMLLIGILLAAISKL